MFEFKISYFWYNIYHIFYKQYYGTEKYIIDFRVDIPLKHQGRHDMMCKYYY